MALHSAALHKSNRRGRWSWMRWVLMSACGAALLAGACIALVKWRARGDATVLHMLHSEDSKQRQLGAWLTAEDQLRAGVDYIARQIELELEPVPDVRESYVHALGRFGSPEHFPAVATVIATDPSSYVRQAAWLAAVRIDQQCFRELAESHPLSEAHDPWEQIGLANAWLRAGDVRGVQTLMHWAHRGDENQQLVACRALFQGLAPLLEVAGRWPLEIEIGEGQIWPPELLTEIERRCGELDLQRVADHVQRHLAAARRLQRDTYRLTSARNWVARILFFF